MIAAGIEGKVYDIKPKSKIDGLLFYAVEITSRDLKESEFLFWFAKEVLPRIVERSTQ